MCTACLRHKYGKKSLRLTVLIYIFVYLFVYLRFESENVLNMFLKLCGIVFQ